MNDYEIIETGNTDVSNERYPWGNGESQRDTKSNVALITGGVGLLAAVGKILYDKFIGGPKAKKALEAQVAKEVNDRLDPLDEMIAQNKEVMALVLKYLKGDDEESEE